MRKNAGERVHGPYRHRNRWRIVIQCGSRQEVQSFESEGEARRAKANRLKEIKGRTVCEAVQEHLMSMRERGLRSSTVDRAEHHLRRFFQLDEVDPETDRNVAFAKSGGMLDDLTAAKCDELYKQLRTAVGVDTHRNGLAAARSFGAWCVERRWLRDNPLESVKPIGERSRGKAQLRIDETRKLVPLLLQHAEQENTGAVAVLAALLLGLRASEVTDRVCRDLDDGGRLLWVPFGKTRRSRRALDVPDVLRPYLLALVKDRKPDEQLVGAGKVPRERRRKDGRRDRHWLLRQVRVFCDMAGLPTVCTHSMRGLHATLATDAGATPHLVAQALGHGSVQVAQRHYTDQGIAHRAKTRRVLDRIAPEGDPAREAPQVDG